MDIPLLRLLSAYTPDQIYIIIYSPDRQVFRSLTFSPNKSRLTAIPLLFNDATAETASSKTSPGKKKSPGQCKNGSLMVLQYMDWKRPNLPLFVLIIMPQSTKKSGFITNNSIVKGIVNLPKIETPRSLIRTVILVDTLGYWYN